MEMVVMLVRLKRQNVARVALGRLCLKITETMLQNIH